MPPVKGVALDLFCGGGCATLGLMSAGWQVIGVDIDPRCAAVYPGAAFVRADVFGEFALDLIRSLRIDWIWASPPCQRWSSPTNLRRTGKGAPRRETHPDLIAPTRRLLERANVPGVIENVPNAPLRSDIVLSGAGCGLPLLHRRRKVECVGWRPAGRDWTAPPRGSVAAGTLVTVTAEGGIPDRNTRAKRRRLRPDLSPDRFHRSEMVAAMELPPDTPLTMRQIGNGVPPRYAEIVADQFAGWLQEAP